MRTFIQLGSPRRHEDGSTARAVWSARSVRFPPRHFTIRVVDETATHLPIIRGVLVPTARPVNVEQTAFF